MKQTVFNLHPWYKVLQLGLLLAAQLGPGTSCSRESVVDGTTFAQQIVEQSGIDRGICALVEGTPDLAISLVQSSDLLVHVRQPDKGVVEAIRSAADKNSLGIDRLVVERGGLDRLPYADNTIDLLVLTEASKEKLAELSVAEVFRVLRPAGIAIIGKSAPSPDTVGAELEDWFKSAKGNRLWKSDFGIFQVASKAVPAGLDEWSHWEHGPDNNPVSSDQIIKAPYLTQFMAEPYYIGMPAITTAAGGRTFLATGHIAHHEREWDMVNKLIARNGYNGTVLWTRQLPEGFLAHRSAFVATEDKFYLIDGNGTLVLDAGTGEKLERIELPGIEDDWRWMAMREGVLYVMAGPQGANAETVKGDRSLGGWSWADLSTGYYQHPRVPWCYGKTLAAFDTHARRLLWKHEEQEPIDARALALLGNKLFLYSPEKYLRCLDARTGEVGWTNSDQEVSDLIEQPGRGLVSTPGFRSSCLAVATPEALILQGQTRMNVVALSAEDGSLLWSKKKFTNNPNVIYVDGKAIMGVGPRGSHVAVEPLTGRVVEDLGFRKTLCTRLTASTDSFFVRGEGTLRYDRASKQVQIDGAVRPACNDGAIPANGMLYLGPWACDCNLSLIGAIAKCSAGDFRFDYVATAAERLETGEGEISSVAPFEITSGDWPTYRANNRRTASIDVPLASPNQAGQTPSVSSWAHHPDQSFVPTPPTCAGGLVFLGGSDGKLRALDLSTGDSVWEFATGGPIKASPTLWQGRAFVGSGDGYVYALEAATGRLLWRFRAAPVERHIMVYGHLCSTWPVNTGILVEDGTAYFAAGIIDTDGTYVYALDARTGEIKWQNNTSGHLNPELRKGVSAQGNLAIHGGELLMAGGNQVSPARFDLHTGKCLNPVFAQGQPKAHHGRFVGVFLDRYPISGGRALYASPRNVANKDSFRVIVNGKATPLSFGGVPPAWNEKAVALVNYRYGELKCYSTAKTSRSMGRDLSRRGDSPSSGPRIYLLADAFEADGALRWETSLDTARLFEVLSLALTPDEVVAVAKVQARYRAHPLWQVAVLKTNDGVPIVEWQEDLAGEPLPEGLAVGRDGRLIVAMLDGTVCSLAPR